MESATITLKSDYSSGIDDLAEDFFVPCLKQAKQYDRVAGFFSSSALVTWGDSLPEIFSGSKKKIRMLVSHRLSQLDKEALLEASESKVAFADKASQEIVRGYFKSAEEFLEEPRDLRLRLDVFIGLI